LLKGKRLYIGKLGDGITNTNYKIDAGKEIYVARFAPHDQVALGVSKASEYRNCLAAY
jgi:hypothetical protein